MDVNMTCSVRRYEQHIWTNLAITDQQIRAEGDVFVSMAVGISGRRNFLKKAAFVAVISRDPSNNMLSFSLKWVRTLKCCGTDCKHVSGTKPIHILNAHVVNRAEYHAWAASSWLECPWHREVHHSALSTPCWDVWWGQTCKTSCSFIFYS